MHHSLTFALLSCGVFASPNHDEVQARTQVHRASQQYGESDRNGRGLASVGSETCQQVHAKTVQPMRIGWELVDVGSVPADKQEYVNKVLMARGAGYYMEALNIRRASAPLRADRVGSECSKYSFETEYRCKSATAPKCGAYEIPAKYLKSKKVCSKSCAPSYSCSNPSACYSGGSCTCDYAAWKTQIGSYCCSLTAPASCPADCSVSTITDLGSGNGICEECTTEAEGAGAVDVDLFLFVTIKDTASCSGATVAYASSCVLDQCDRPIFGSVNFCLTKVSLDAADLEDQVSTAIHEMAHILAFSSSLFMYFRNADGTPKIARESSDATQVQGAIRWTCSSNTYTWNDGSGSRSYVDLSASNIVKSFSERGLASCPCPIGKSTLSSGCIIPQTGLRTPTCVMKFVTPKVLEKVREHFDCSTLNGAELENQPTAECSIVGSHWEERIFMADIMAPVMTTNAGPAFVSAVTLALFEDSGWYVPNYAMADVLVKGVHWGYKQGCSFATASCVSAGSTAHPRHWCTTPDTSICSLERTGVKKCKVDTYQSALPSVISYFSDGLKAGNLAEADYCPMYNTGISNRVCTSTDSTWAVASNANYMREVMGTGSRCLDSTLHADVQVSGGTIPATASDFATAQPGCFDIVCNADRTAYVVKISDMAGGTISFGTCTAAAQALTGTGLQGQITCVAPAEICGVSPSKLYGVFNATNGSSGYSSGSSGSSGSTTGTKSSGTTGTNESESALVASASRCAGCAAVVICLCMQILLASITSGEAH